MTYFDATFIAKLYLREPESNQLRTYVKESDSHLVSSILGKMETVATFHRKLREREIDLTYFQSIHVQFQDDIDSDRLSWISMSPAIVERVHHAFLNLPANVFLRTGDAIHLATASEAGFKEIYSNDRHLLAAASLFKLKAINPLGKSSKMSP